MSKALKSAIEANDPDAVSKALKGVKDLNRKLPGAQPPLLYACATGADKVLEVLFKAGAIGEERNTFPDDTPFAVAAAHRQFQVMKRLLALKQASDKAIRSVTQSACMDGNADVLAFVLEEVKPPIDIGLFRLASVPSKAPTLLKMLVEHGGDLKARHDTSDAKVMTPLHDLVDSGKADVIRTLIECGADVNARDGLGRTPLMVLASDLEGIEIGNDHAVSLQESLASGEATLLSGEGPSTVNSLEAVQTLLSLGADARLKDHSGNDAIDHCTFEYMRCDKEPAPEIIRALRKAGAKGSAATLELFEALKRKNLRRLRSAITKGADPNRLTPPPVPFTPLTWAATSEPDAIKFVRALLEAGADPNKSNGSVTPLIRAARCGNLAVVRELLGAGAQLHTVCDCGDFIENAYSAAEGKDEVRDYLKSLGARNPVRAEAEPLTPGVKSWNDFSELLVKGRVEHVAEGISRMIQGTARLDVYGESLTAGRQAYVVVRPTGMNWCNVFQIAPPRLRYEESEKTEAFAAALAKACRASVLVIDYSDTADAASILRLEPKGKTTKDAGWDRESLTEIVEAMGEDAPAWAKKQLAKTSDDEPSSTERLTMLAEKEKFVVAAFGLSGEAGQEVDLEFTGYGKESFDGVAFVSK